MGLEIEYKYLVNKIPFSLVEFKHSEIEQVYLSIPNAPENSSYRLRIMDGKILYCVKGEGLVQREEKEYEIPVEKYDELIKFMYGYPICKTRYFIPIQDGLIAELDIYHKQLNGLMTVEVEFKPEYDRNKFVPPVWFGKDVTSDARYKNASLANLDNIDSLL